MGKQKKATPAAYQVRVSDNAFRNIEEITGYIAFIEQQPLNAIKVGNAIFDVIDRIGKNPLAFRECEELATKSRMYRRAVCFSWLIIYKIAGTDIIILAIIHGARRPSAIRQVRKIK
jgi:plasmid stabilization system protein ParE